MSKESELYDRQIRLWGQDGQKAIAEATLYVCGSDICATELLKSLILHSVRDVIIVDDAIVTEQDLLTNFFTDGDSVGKPRAEVTAALLGELNQDAKIVPVIESPDKLPGFEKLGPNGIVLTTGNKTLEELKTLNVRCRAQGVKQIHFQSTGFFGAFYVDAGLHHIIEGGVSAQHPVELRILNPFPELVEFWESFDFENCSDIEHAHIPFTAILHRARQMVMKEAGVEKLTWAHKGKLAEAIRSMRRNRKDKDPVEFADEVSFDEAEEQIGLAYGTAFPSSNTLECFEVFKANEANIGDAPFWRLVRATMNFYNKHGVLPHYGGCPDMECLPNYYREHKRLYVERSARDWEEVTADAGGDIDAAYLKRFATSVWRINGVVYKPMEEVLIQKPTTEWWDESARDSFNRISCVQLLFIAARSFLAKNGRSPDNTEADRAEILADILAQGADANEAPKFAEEFCRYKGTVLPSVVATLGAVLAQEATQIIIKQATPMKGIVVYDAIHAILQEPAQ